MYKAIKDYDLKRDVKFKTFAEICILRNVFNALNKANNNRNSILNDSLNIDFGVSSNDISDNIKYSEDISKLMKKLTLMERRVFNLYLKGYDRQKISDELKKDKKSISNTLYRIKEKMKEL